MATSCINFTMNNGKKKCLFVVAFLLSVIDGNKTDTGKDTGGYQDKRIRPN